MRRIPFESSWILLLQFFFCSDQHEYIILWFNEFFFLLWRCMTWPNRFYQVVKFAYFLQWFCVDCDQWEYANRREKQKKCIVESRRNRGCCSSDSMAHVRRTITCVSCACVYRLMTPQKKKKRTTYGFLWIRKWEWWHLFILVLSVGKRSVPITHPTWMHLSWKWRSAPRWFYW